MSIAHEKNHVLSGTFVISTTELQNQSLLLLLNGSVDDGFSVAIHVARARIYCCKGIKIKSVQMETSVLYINSNQDTDCQDSKMVYFYYKLYLIV